MNGLLTVSMIVKNEERFLPECLASVKDVADEIIVVDTGSTDRTVEIAQSFGARVIEIEWPNDFAKARNVGLDAVKTPWVLVMDADEELVRDDVPVLEAAISKPLGDAYNIRIVSVMDRADQISESYVSRLFRSHPDVRYEGKIHEQIFQSLTRANMRLVALNLRLLHKGYLGAVVDQRNKAERNRALLESHLKENPEDGYMWWQYAQTLMGAAKFEEGLAAAKRSLKFIAMENPLWVLAQTTLARLYELTRQHRRALRALNDGEIAYPKYTDFWYVEGEFHMAGNDFPNAERCFRKCLEIGEAKNFLMTDTGVGSFKALYRLAGALARQGNAKEATATLLLTIQKHPTYRDAWHGLFNLLAGSSFDAVAQTILLVMPVEDIIKTIEAWPNLSDNERGLLEAAKRQMAVTRQS
ncbi:glycosyltransferase family 2 protein [Sulfobacillus harzensis]|uniref:Glycosyltransferase n=1 Tax=Sulfobacillus harzensis TaxID=2729629 RepID=A0A7Y0L133_9FIRM|nr:glycosyltransferase family 2 protein [Sulfobacillus harzensis]NMP21342.1 glycosyltransferase [Sulfobacillus harzensis]